MGKQSRRQRKQIREKRDHAEDHGLPVGELPQTKPDTASNVRMKPVRADRVGHAAGATVEPTHGVSARDNATIGLASPGLAWSTWPLSIKLVVGGILLLVAIGLYRRCSEVRDPDVGASSATVPAQGVTPNVSNPSPPPGTERASGSAVLPIATPAGGLD